MQLSSNTKRKMVPTTIWSSRPWLGWNITLFVFVYALLLRGSNAREQQQQVRLEQPTEEENNHYPMIWIESIATEQQQLDVVDDDDDDEDLPISLPKDIPPPPDCSNPKNKAKHRLACWLYQHEIDIPDQSFHKEIFYVFIGGMICSEFQIQGIHSTYKPSTSTGAPQISIHVSNIAASCHGRYKSGAMSGRVSVTVQGGNGKDNNYTTGSNDNDGLTLTIELRQLKDHHQQQQLQQMMTIDSTNDGTGTSSSSTSSIVMPGSAHTDLCQTNILVPHNGIHFSGSMSAKIINLFSSTIASYVTTALEEQLCPLLVQTIDDQFTDVIHQVDDVLQQYLPKEQQQQQQQQQSSYRPSRQEKNPKDTNDHDSLHHHVQGMATSQQRQQYQQQNLWELSNSAQRIPTTTIAMEDTLRKLKMQALESPTSNTFGLDSNTTTNTTITNPTILPVLHSLLTLSNNMITEWLNNSTFLGWGWIPAACDQEDCGVFFDGITGMLRYYTDGTIRILAPRVLKNLTFPLSYDAQMTLRFDHFVWSGFDQLDDLQLLQPTMYEKKSSNSSNSSNSSSTNHGQVHVLRSNLVSPGWNMTARAHLSIQTKQQKKEQQQHESEFWMEPLEESFDIHLNVSSIHAMAQLLFMANDWNDMSLWQVVMAMQDITDNKNEELRQKGMECLVSSISSIRILPGIIAKVLVDSMTVTPIEVRDNSLEHDLDELANAVMKLVLKEYPVLITSLIQGISEGPGLKSLNEMIKQFLNTWSGPTNDTHGDETFQSFETSVSPSCRPIAPQSNPHWLNFTKFEIIKVINDYLNRNDTMVGTNQYLDCISRLFVRHNTTTAMSNLPHLTLHQNSSDNHAFSLTIHNFTLENFDTLQNLTILSPFSGDSQDTTYLQTSIAWGDSQRPGKASVGVKLVVPALDIDADVHVTAFLEDLQVILGTRLDYDLNSLMNISVAKVLTQAQCGLVPASEMRLDQTSQLKLGNFGVNVSGTVSRQKYKDVRIDIRTSDYPSFHELVESIVDWSWSWTRRVTNRAAEALIVTGAGLCEGVTSSSTDRGHSRQKSHGEPTWREIPVLAVVGLLFVMGQVALFLLVTKSRNVEPDQYELTEPLLTITDRVDYTDEGSMDIMEPTLSQVQRDLNRHPFEECFDEMIEPSDNKAQNEFDQQLLQDIIEDMEDDESRNRVRVLEEQQEEPRPRICKSLFGSIELSELVRHGIPILIIGTIVLLLSSNLSIGASVDLVISLGGDSHIQLPGMFTFSLASTISEMFQAGIYVLLVLVVGFSGIWPYGKLMLMFHAWMKKPSTAHKRERLLLALDALGKFSLVDTYVLVLMTVAFRYHLRVTDGIVLDVYVSPQYGFYGFLLATCISMVMGHVMVYCHRRAESRPKMADDAKAESLFDHEYDVQGNGVSRVRLSRFFQLIVFSCSLVAFVLMCIGMSKRSFTFEFGGLAGMALGDQDDRRTSYSLLSLGTAIGHSVQDPATFGIAFLQFAFYFYAVATPLLCLSLIIALLIYPLSYSAQRSLLTLAELANAWSAIEVFALSIIASVFQISTFASFIVGDKCDFLSDFLESIVDDDKNLGSPHCYTVDSYLESDCWYLVAGVILNSNVVSFVLKLAHCAIEERALRSSISQCQLNDGGASEQPHLREDHAPREQNHVTASVESSIAMTMFRLSPMRTFLFEKTHSSLNGDTPLLENYEGGEEEEEEELPEWRFWF